MALFFGNQVRPQLVLLLQTVSFFFSHTSLDFGQLNHKLAFLVFECACMNRLGRLKLISVSSLLFVQFRAIEGVLAGNLGVQVCQLRIKALLLLLEQPIVILNRRFELSCVSLIHIFKFATVTLLIGQQLVPVFFVYAIYSLVQIFQLLSKTTLLICEQSVVLVKGLFKVNSISFFLCSEVFSVASVTTFKFIGKLLQLVCVSLFCRLLFILPGIFALGCLFTQLVYRVVLFLNFAVVTLLLPIQTIQVVLLGFGPHSLLLLNLVHQLLNLLLKTFLELFLHFGVFFEFLGRSRDGYLQCLAAFLTLANEFLALRHVVFEVVVHLQFLVQRNERIQFVFQFDLALLQSYLKFFIAALIQVCLRKTSPSH